MNRLKRIAMWTAGAILALLAAYRIGRVQEDNENTINDYENEREGTKRVIETDINVDRDSAIERLRKTGRLRD